MPRRRSSPASWRGREVPVTPLHMAGAWAFHLLTRRQGSFVAATLGSVLIDLEVPVYWVVTGFDKFQSRGLMHSLLGVFTFNVAVAFLVYRYGMPRLWRWAMRRWPEARTYRFAGDDVRLDTGGVPMFYLSAVAGGLSHLWLDLPTHSFNPLLWPYTADPLNLVPFSEWPPWEIGFNAALLVILAVMLWKHWGIRAR